MKMALQHALTAYLIAIAAAAHAILVAAPASAVAVAVDVAPVDVAAAMARASSWWRATCGWSLGCRSHCALVRA
jgi:hypothetical protein